jgi:hypothetical protein
MLEKDPSFHGQMQKGEEETRVWGELSLAPVTTEPNGG